MKNLLLLLIIPSLFSCEKSNIGCKCGKIKELYSRQVALRNNTVVNLGYKIKVKNNESKNIKIFKTNKKSFYIDEEFCSDKSW